VEPQRGVSRLEFLIEETTMTTDGLSAHGGGVSAGVPPASLNLAALAELLTAPAGIQERITKFEMARGAAEQALDALRIGHDIITAREAASVALADAQAKLRDAVAAREVADKYALETRRAAEAAAGEYTSEKKRLADAMLAQAAATNAAADKALRDARAAEAQHTQDAAAARQAKEHAATTAERLQGKIDRLHAALGEVK
jgi:hypothetical protein